VQGQPGMVVQIVIPVLPEYEMSEALDEMLVATKQLIVQSLAQSVTPIILQHNFMQKHPEEGGHFG